MPRSCIICSAVASQDMHIIIQYCGACKSALYCSRACQKKDWKKHKEICKLLNVGHGDMQVRNYSHTSRSVAHKEEFEKGERILTEHMKRFFKLFMESTFDGSRAAAQKMKEIVKLQTKQHQQFLLFHSLNLLVTSSKSKMLSWPNSPLLVMLHFVDPNVLDGNEETRLTPLHYLADLADPVDYSTHERQLILANQLTEHGANVNAVSKPSGATPLHKACYSGNVTNLDFVEFLLEKGADPNAQDHLGLTPLMYTFNSAPGAANFLLKWPTTDANITTRSGASFLATVRETVEYVSDRAARPDNSDRVQDQFSLKRWREIEDMLVERGAVDTGITTLE
jgi:hypothetical protein